VCCLFGVLTSSCYHPTKLRCGECFTCAKRWIAENYVAFKRGRSYAGLFMPYDTPINPLTNKHILGFKDSYFKAYSEDDYSHFHKNRIMKDSVTILKYIAKIYKSQGEL